MANKFRLDGVVGYDFTAAYVASQLEGEGDVEITINSPGGDVSEGMAIYNAILDHAGKVTMYIDQAMSMGSIIMLAADERIGRRESSMVMIHRPWGMGVGTADDMRDGAATLDKMQGQMESIYLGAMSVSQDKLAKMLDDETFLDADEAMALGLITQVIEGSKSALHQMAFAALANNKDMFSSSKFAAKVRQIEAKGGDFCAKLQNADKLSEIEGAVRSRFGASQTEATAIVGAVKRLQGDLADEKPDLQAKALETLSKFNF